MRNHNRRHWTDYLDSGLYSGCIALILSIIGYGALTVVLSGCRVGNHSDPGVLPDIGQSGFFATEPQSLVVTTSQTVGSHTVNASVDEIPSLFSGNFTNPAELLEVDPATGLAAVFRPTNGQPGDLFSLFVDEPSGDQTGISVSSDTGWSQAWADPSSTCQVETSLLLLGDLVSLGSTPDSMDSPIGTVKLRGRIQFDSVYRTRYRGECTDDWKSMSDCYSTLALCPGADATEQRQWQNKAQGRYDYYVTIGALSVSEISSTQTLGFEVVYK